MWMMRWACRAMSCSCVTSTMVLPSLVQPLEQRHDFVAGGGIEVAGGLVGQQDRGVVHQRAGHGHALPLAAGKLVGLVVHALLQIHLLQRLSWPCSMRSAGGHAGIDQRQFHIVQRRWRAAAG